MDTDKLLSITELAKLRRLTSETLRYYDRIGLIHPEYVDPETRYRYYSIRQYEKVGTIKELRQLGMSIKEILDYFAGRNLEKSVAMLREHQKLLSDEIREKKLLNRILSRKLSFIEDLKNIKEVEKPFEYDFPVRSMITFGEPAGGPREHAYSFTRLERYLNAAAPILASDRVGVYAGSELLERTDKSIPCVPMLFLDDELSGEIEYEVEIDAGHYVCMYYRNGRLEEYHPSFEILKKYLKDKSFCVSGNIFQTYKIDVTLTDVSSETMMEVQVPVKKQS